MKIYNKGECKDKHNCNIIKGEVVDCNITISGHSRQSLYFCPAKTMRIRLSIERYQIYYKSKELGKENRFFAKRHLVASHTGTNDQCELHFGATTTETLIACG